VQSNRNSIRQTQTPLYHRHQTHGRFRRAQRLRAYVSDDLAPAQHISLRGLGKGRQAWSRIRKSAHDVEHAHDIMGVRRGIPSPSTNGMQRRYDDSLRSSSYNRRSYDSDFTPVVIPVPEVPGRSLW